MKPLLHARRSWILVLAWLGLVASLGLLGPGELSSGARAQLPAEETGPTDWAESLPACGFVAAPYEGQPLLLLYPSPGLPAMVEQGAALIARIRMPSALTPPPGHQQDSALRGFDAQLLASGGQALDDAHSVYELRVADVRPDAGSSMIYRLRLPIPRWVAPGTYSLRVRAPSSGVRVGVASVRVLAEGEAPRVLVLSAPTSNDIDRLRQRLRDLEGYPADVFVVPFTPELGVALNATRELASWPPVLLTGRPGQAGVVRVGQRRASLGQCTSSLYQRPQGDSEARPWVGVQARDAALHARWSTPGALAPVLERRLDDGGVHVRAASWLSAPAELRVVVPEDGRATRIVDAASTSWWPGAALFATALAPSLVANVTLAPGQEASLTRGPAAPLGLRLHANPTRATTDDHVDLHAETTRPAQIAWRLAEDVTAVGARTHHRWASNGDVEIHALAIDAEGVPGRASVTLPVGTRREFVCSSSAAPSGPRGAPLGALGLVILAVLWTIRRRRHRMRPPAGMNRGSSGIQP